MNSKTGYIGARPPMYIRSVSTVYDKIKQINYMNKRKNNMLNNVTFMGRLVETPELRMTKTEIPVTSFRLACSRDYVSSGDKRESDFVDVDAWRSQAEFACKYFTKGQLMIVTGRLKNKQWTDKHEQKRTDTVIEAENIYFGESKAKDGSKDEIDPFAGGASAPQGAGGFPQASTQFPASPWG